MLLHFPTTLSLSLRDGFDISDVESTDFQQLQVDGFEGSPRPVGTSGVETGQPPRSWQTRWGLRCVAWRNGHFSSLKSCPRGPACTVGCQQKSTYKMFNILKEKEKELMKRLLNR